MVAPVVDVPTAAALDAALANAPVVSRLSSLEAGNKGARETEKNANDRRSNAAVSEPQPFNSLNTLNLNLLLTTNTNTNKAVVSFWASWAAGPCNQMDAVAAELAKDYLGAVPFFRVEADGVASSAAAERLGVAAVPTTVFVKNGAVAGKVEGPDPPALVDAVAAQLEPPPRAEAKEAKEVEEGAPSSSSGVPAEPLDSSGNLTETAKRALEALVKKHPVMLFMKGDPDQPRCGFSRKVVEALRASGLDEPQQLGTFDILSDDGVRSGLKVFSDWPTFPQLYVSGELVGGCDIVLEMAQEGTLRKTVDEMLSVL